MPLDLLIEVVSCYLPVNCKPGPGGGSHREAAPSFIKISLSTCPCWQERYEKAVRPGCKVRTHTSYAGWKRTSAEILGINFCVSWYYSVFFPRRLTHLVQMARSRL